MKCRRCEVEIEGLFLRVSEWVPRGGPRLGGGQLMGVEDTGAVCVTCRPLRPTRRERKAWEVRKRVAIARVFLGGASRAARTFGGPPGMAVIVADMRVGISIIESQPPPWIQMDEEEL